MTAPYALDPRNARVRDAKAKEVLRKSLEALKRKREASLFLRQAIREKMERDETGI